MRTFRQDFLGDETAVFVDRDRPTRDPDLLILRDARATHVDGAAREPDVVQVQAVLAIGRQQFLVACRCLVFVRRVGFVMDDPQRLCHRLVEPAVFSVGAKHVGQLPRGALQVIRLWIPGCNTLGIDRYDLERLGLHRLAVRKDPNFGTIDEVRVIRIHPELHRTRRREYPQAVKRDPWLVRDRGRQRDPIRFRGNAQSRRRTKVVEAELDVGFFHRHVRATLDVGRAPLWIVDRLTVNRNTHQVEAQRILGRQLARHSRDIDTLVVVENGKLIVNGLDRNVRGFALDETGVDNVVGMHEATALEFRLGRLEAHLSGDPVHRPARPRRRQTDIVAIHGRGPARQAFVTCVADESQTRIRPVRNIGQRAGKRVGIPGWNHRLTVCETDVGDRAPGWIVDARHDFGAGRFRAQLRLVRQLLQRIVVPELDFDAAVECTALRRLVRSNRAFHAPAVAIDGIGR